MKTTRTFLTVLTACLILMNCSSDNDESISQPENENPPEIINPLDIDIPMEPLATIGAVEIAGLPKMLKKISDGNLIFWAQYYYRPDGQLLKMKYRYINPESTTIYADTYHYDSDGRLIKLDGHDSYDFYWDQGRIVKAHRYNGMWYGNSDIFYEYNNEGLPIEKLEINTDFNFKEKLHYTYFENGDLKSIVQYGDYDGSGVFINYMETNYTRYNGDINLFPELQIIPGKNGQKHFPSTMELIYTVATGYDLHETYTYKHDTFGRVIQKQSGSNKILYEYY
ncbi:hypothetical protein NA63_2261 [Flavobacteriaceae bacterium MAR_2010_105]|nr:hypothetical protein NA63_2261 [Flavobacteriaceae bacterium MAR_2010_105]